MISGFFGGIWSWLTSIPVAIWGSLLAGTFTLLGVVLAQAVVYSREQQNAEDEVKALRAALLTELNSVNGWLKTTLYNAHDIEEARKHTYFESEKVENAFDNELRGRLSTLLSTRYSTVDSMPVFHSNADKIGSLDRETAKYIIKFHQSFSLLNESIKELPKTIDYGDLADDEEAWSDPHDMPTEAYMILGRIKDATVTATLYHKRAIHNLGGKVTESDRTALVFALAHKNPHSEENKELQEKIENITDSGEYSYEDLTELIEL